MSQAEKQIIDYLKQIAASSRGGGGNLESISDSELLQVTAGAVDMGTLSGGSSDGNRGRRIVYDKVRDKQWTIYASAQSNFGVAATPNIIMGADPTSVASFAKRPFFYGYLHMHLTWAGGHIAGENVSWQMTQSNGNAANPDVTITHQIRMRWPGAGAAAAPSENWIMPFPIAFQSLALYNVAPNTGTVQVDIHFEGWQYFVN